MFVIGGSKGIGCGIVEGFVVEGVWVVLMLRLLESA